MSSDAAIVVERLSKCYHIYDKPRDRLLQMFAPPGKQYFREFWALRDVTFDVARGETVGIVGRNGSGKSTLLQMICGTLNPTRGNISVGGRIGALLELGSGFNPNFSGRENVFLNAALLGLSDQKTQERYEDILAFADIGDFINQPVRTYSSGMIVRLAFAVQAMLEPDVLIVDEALAVGDEKFQRKCFAWIEELKSQGTAVLFVSHSGPQVIQLCERALFLEGGEKVMYSLPPKVVRSYQRLIYAPYEQQQQLLEEFRGGEASAAAPEGGQGRVHSEPAAQTESGDWFDAGLVPETTTAYPPQGAEIEQFAIEDNDGRAVNVLRPNESYRVVVSGRVLNDLERIYFGVHIRSISGAVISGQRYPAEGCYIDGMRAGMNFRIEYGFNMALLPDVYFVGGGVWSANDPGCVHRILDALMFRVQSLGAQNSFGYCSLMSAPAVLALE